MKLFVSFRVFFPPVDVEKAVCLRIIIIVSLVLCVGSHEEIANKIINVTYRHFSFIDAHTPSTNNGIPLLCCLILEIRRIKIVSKPVSVAPCLYHQLFLFYMRIF